MVLLPSLLSVQQKKRFFSFFPFLVHRGILSIAHWKVTEDEETLCSAVSKLPRESGHSCFPCCVSSLPPEAQSFFHSRPGVHFDQLVRAEHA